MSDSTVPGDRLKDIRSCQGLTQEGLAERAGLCLGTVKKIERGGTARIETYHALARALGVRTSRLFEPVAPHAQRRAESVRDRVDLLPLRQAICPPMGLSGRLGLTASVEEEPDLGAMWETARALDASYHQNEYGDIAELLPPLIWSAQTAVAHFDEGPRHFDAFRLRSDAFQQAGRYLTQVRSYDLAHVALREAIQDAMAGGDRLSAGAAVDLQGWALMRQGRMDEAEQVVIATGDAIEPRISRASKDEMAVWGRLLIKGSAAAARNNRPKEARQMLKLARTAGVVIGDGGAGQAYKSGRFNGLSVAYQAIENYMITNKPDRVLALSMRIPAESAPTSNTRNRHLLDIARAHTKLRHNGDATEILTDLARQAPDWLRHQQLAVDAFDDVLRTSKRLSKKQRALAAFFNMA